METAQKAGTCFRRRPYRPVATVSVIIPALNEGPHMERCIQSLLQQTPVPQIIVAEAGSRRGGPCITGSDRVRVIPCIRKGRGIQIAEGIRHAAGDVLLILHADCILTQGSIRNMIDGLNRHRHTVGGAFAMDFPASPPKLRRVAFLNNLRARLSGISFGDQGQFFRRELLDPLGGFPGQMLMEDVELSLRMKSVGPLLFLPLGVLASSRTWRAKKYLPRILQVASFFAAYLAVRTLCDPRKAAAVFYRHYYGR